MPQENRQIPCAQWFIFRLKFPIVLRGKIVRRALIPVPETSSSLNEAITRQE